MYLKGFPLDDPYHQRVVLQQVPLVSSFSSILRDFLGGALPMAWRRQSGDQPWQWEPCVVEIEADDSVEWQWSHAPLSIIAADRHGTPLSADHRHFFSSGLPAPAGSFIHTFHATGTYHFRAGTGTGAGGKVVVLSEWQTLRKGLLRGASIITIAFLALWVAMLATAAVALSLARPASSSPLLNRLTYTLCVFAAPAAGSGILVAVLCLPLAALHSLRAPRLRSYGRGYAPRVHRRVRLAAAAAAVLLAVATAGSWSAMIQLMTATDGVVAVAATGLEVCQP